MPQKREASSKTSFIIEVDDNADVENLKYLLEPLLPPEVVMLTSNYDLVNYNWQTVKIENVQFFSQIYRFEMNTSKANFGSAGNTTQRAFKDSEFSRVI